MKHKDDLLNGIGLRELPKTPFGPVQKGSPSSSLRNVSQQVNKLGASCDEGSYKQSSSPSLPSLISLDNTEAKLNTESQPKKKMNIYLTNTKRGVGANSKVKSAKQVIQEVKTTKPAR